MRIRAPWDDVLSEPLNHDHLVQVYEDEDAVRCAFALFAEVGFGKGDAVVAVVTPEHGEAFRDTLSDHGFDPYGLQRWGQLRFADASSMLRTVMRGAAPDAATFRLLLEAMLADAAARARTGRVRLYGEMVNLLWREWNLRGAAALERLGNEVVRLYSVAVLCAYGVEPEAPPLPPTLVQLHTHFIPVDACG